MRRYHELLRAEPLARWFFLALTQSAIGTGAGYVALLLIAYERFESPWAVSLVLVADLVAAMALGPLFGAVADRFSRRTCCVIADLVRAIAFVGMAVVPSFEATVLFAVVAGAGTALFTPAALSSLPSLVSRPRLPTATSIFGAVADLGFTVGPAVAAAAFLIVGPEALLVVNGLSFLASAAILAGLPFALGSAQGGAAPAQSLFADTRAGLRAVRTLPVVRVVLSASGAGLLFAALFNAAELPFVTGELGGGEAAFALLVAVFGVGFLAGSLVGARGGEILELKRHYLLGLLLMAGGLLGTGLSGGIAAASVAFLAAGVGNGLMLVYERLLIQELVPDAMTGRVYGIKEGITAWAFAVGFLAAGVLLTGLGARATILVAGGAALLALFVSSLFLRRATGLGRRADAMDERALGENGSDLVHRRGGGQVVLD